jgi:hypothetical protein
LTQNSNPLAPASKNRFSPDEKALTAVWDYSASPYALGDTLTWSMLSGIAALNAGKKCFDVGVLVDRQKPGCRVQDYVTPDTYHKFLIDVLPAFFVNPMMRNFHLYHDRQSLEQEIYHQNSSKEDIFPSYQQYLDGYREAFALYNTHTSINLFYQDHGYIPRLCVPPAYQLWATQFLKNHQPNTFFVCVHLRNRKVHTDQTPAEPERDGNFKEWGQFFDIVLKAYPHVKFIVLGRPLEWPDDFFHRRNVIILKTLGYGLMEELAMVRKCDLFMGSNSGPAVMAIFGDSPYLLFHHNKNYQYTARIYEVEPHTETLPFAAAHQTIKWILPNVDALVSMFAEKYEQITGNKV